MVLLTARSVHSLQPWKAGGLDLRDLQLNGRGRVASMNSPVGPGDVYGATYENTPPSQLDPFQVIRRRLWAILLVMFVCAGLAGGFSFAQTPTYQTSILVLIGQKQQGDVPTSLQGDVIGLQQVTQTVATAATTSPISEGVAQKLDLDSPVLPGSLSAEAIEGTTFVEVSYEDTDPKRAQLIANTAGEVLATRISEVSPGTSAVTATLWQEATIPESPISPEPTRNILLGLLLGLMIGVGLAFLLDYLDDDWSSPEVAEKVSGVPTFGVIPVFDTRRIVRKIKKEERPR
jgi:capsular polysaccharide biosynthesis protein